jgi:hypothetical protein
LNVLPTPLNPAFERHLLNQQMNSLLGENGQVQPAFGFPYFSSQWQGNVLPIAGYSYDMRAVMPPFHPFEPPLGEGFPSLLSSAPGLPRAAQGSNASGLGFAIDANEPPFFSSSGLDGANLPPFLRDDSDGSISSQVASNPSNDLLQLQSQQALYERSQQQVELPFAAVGASTTGMNSGNGVAFAHHLPESVQPQHPQEPRQQQPQQLLLLQQQQDLMSMLQNVDNDQERRRLLASYFAVAEPPRR